MLRASDSNPFGRSLRLDDPLFGSIQPAVIKREGKREFVSQSTPHSSPDRAVVFQENGELAEFVDLLSELAVPVEKRSTAAVDSKDIKDARLVVIPGRRLIEAGPKNVRQ